MSTHLIVVLAFGLAMDAFAVSITNGMCYRVPALKNALSSGAAFGVAQGLMPLIGCYAGNAFRDVAGSVDHWLALALLSFIGGRMIYDACRERESAHNGVILKAFSQRTLGLQALATSVDALAVGVGLGVMRADALLAAGVIALVTFLCCFAGVLIGRYFGRLLQNKAEILGGLLLIFIGLHIFIEHMHIHAH